ncbi:MAG: molybdopterin-dependent oxidoreductase [Chromatiales bacterium]|nr:molybdopterin-dependent oxidoreductase [Chromatiales bacterium]
MDSSTITTCPYCGVGCGVVVSRADDGTITVRGDPDHPANLGKLCSKGSALGETVSTEGRLERPNLYGKPASWEQVFETMALRFGEVIREYGPNAVAFYVSGQLLTEDYYVANKLMKGFIGSGNIDTNSRLCMSSSVSGHKRAFGSDTVPACYEDLELADLIVLTGSNTAWCHPVLYQRIVKAKRARPQMRVVVIDPRNTATGDIADLHLPLRPGSDGVLFNGLLTWLHHDGHRDEDFVHDHTNGLDEALRFALWYSPSALAVAEHCDLPVERVETFYRWFAETQKVITVYSQGINQSSSGTDKVNAIINCHLFTGRIGKPGSGPFSFTGQPNAMGGREVGALANQLTAHMDFDRPDHIERVGRFWQAPRMANGPGLKAVDLFRAVERGEVKALWIMGTNPAVSLPDANQVRRALGKCEFLAVSDCVHNDTTGYAHALLPAQTWGEKDGSVTNSERRISRQRPFLSAPGESKPDWWMLSRLAQGMGFSGFDYHGPREIFAEFAALSGFENEGERDFDISALAGLDAQTYDRLSPVQWPIARDGQGRQRLFGDGRFFTDDRRARFVAVAPNPPGRSPEPAYPLILNTGRVRDQWHTMTRTGRSPRLFGHVPEPYCEIHPEDARALGIPEGALVRVTSRWGEVIVRGKFSTGQRRGSVFVPMHWNDQFASAGGIGAVVNAVLDPISGQPEFKHTPVNVRHYRPAWHGFVLSRRSVEPRNATYWTKARRQGMWHYELAGEERSENWADCARAILAVEDHDLAWSEMRDPAMSRYRAALFDGERLQACIFIGPDCKLPPRDWLVQLFRKDRLESRERAALLSGAPGANQEDQGRIVCACFGVGENTIRKAVRDRGLTTPEAVGEVLKAGTNCGSCVAELRALIAETRSA